MIRVPLHERANGRWASILPMVGIPRELLTRRNQPCPWCGGKDRFRWTDHKGTGAWICNQCGHGTGIDLVIKLLGVPFNEAAKKVEEVIGKAEIAPQATRTPVGAMRRLWASATALNGTCPASAYLTGRGIDFGGTFPRALRFARSAWADASYRGPAMLGQVVSGGRGVNIHKTFLGEERRKLLMKAEVPPGSVVMLGQAAERMGVAEGIETALSASLLYGMPVWSALNAGNLEKFRPPQLCREIWIFGDHDWSFQGQASAYKLAHSLAKTGIRVNVEIPEDVGTDFNDVLMARRG